MPWLHGSLCRCRRAAGGEWLRLRASRVTKDRRKILLVSSRHIFLHHMFPEFNFKSENDPSNSNIGTDSYIHCPRHFLNLNLKTRSAGRLALRYFPPFCTLHSPHRTAHFDFDFDHGDDVLSYRPVRSTYLSPLISITFQEKVAVNCITYSS